MEAIKLNPNFIQAHRTLSRITRYTDNDEHFKVLKNLHKNIDISNSFKYNLSIEETSGATLFDNQTFNPNIPTMDNSLTPNSDLGPGFHTDGIGNTYRRWQSKLLYPNTNYAYKMQIENEFGKSFFTDICNISTQTPVPTKISPILPSASISVFEIVLGFALIVRAKINTTLFDTEADEVVIEVEKYEFCVQHEREDDVVVGFVVKACNVERSCPKVFTLNSKGANNF